MNKTLQLLLCLFVLSACGGEQSKDSDISTTEDSESSNEVLSEWVKGNFQSESNYQAKCATPRSGIDPLTNATYPDQPGTP